MITRSLRRPDMRRAVVLFPSGLTLGNLFFGVWAIIAASRGNYSQAGLFVIFGGICDAFDGRVARATGTGGRFGEELDSLVDAITFGLAPAMIMYFAVFRNGWDWLLCFFFTMCAVLRLARFNVVQAGTSKRYFQGLPSPAAGITLATYYWFSQSRLYTDTNIADWPWHQMLRVVMGMLSFLMISNVPYPVVPKLGLRSIDGWAAVVFLAGGVSILLFRKWEYFFPLAMLYVVFGLVRAVIIGWLERRANEEIEDSVPRGELAEAADEEYERPTPRPPRHTPHAVHPPIARRPTPIANVTHVTPMVAGSDDARAGRRRKRRRRNRGGGGQGNPHTPNPSSPDDSDE